ncbi:hypothetical protein GCM10010277_87820 [Streptomyces longisporoflavus]|uniref:hypothetical protein n=1 Tax=Streptomyces longisporoflavus TaxID=28044 RepID=UPI00167CEA2D|nr:hypothetical protein [Streptomyces longisporoflavus]GGV73884.1 hypothetical protein GCM10010277_87820 [Streptomyces longisporoflavus]
MTSALPTPQPATALDKRAPEGTGPPPAILYRVPEPDVAAGPLRPARLHLVCGGPGAGRAS